ncbi:transposase [Streptomyces sp. NBC_00467]|uniref:transposase n=1 Tax=Streptomyces sp. NBC_00467 TaxID=2975752 RepID=UPI002E17DD8D
MQGSRPADRALGRVPGARSFWGWPGAGVQDRDAALDVFWRLRLTQPQITQVWADRGYAGDLVDWARDRLWLSLRIVSWSKGVKGFLVLPRRWKVERTIGWCMNACRTPRDYERLSQLSEAHLNWALITTMTWRLTCKSPRTATRCIDLQRCSRG